MLPVYVELFRCNKKHSATLCFLQPHAAGWGLGGLGVFGGPGPCEQECFAAVAWGDSCCCLAAVAVLLGCWKSLLVLCYLSSGVLLEFLPDFTGCVMVLELCCVPLRA